jgi:hypothetical protein
MLGLPDLKMDFDMPAARRIECKRALMRIPHRGSVATP